MNVNDDIDENVLLISQVDDINLTIIESLLKDSNISFLRKRRGVGNLFKIYFGKSFEVTDIYVTKKDYEKAKELTDVYFALPDADTQEEIEMAVESDVKFLKMSKWVIRIIFAIMGIAFLAAAIVSVISQIS